MERTKTQGNGIQGPDGVPEGTIISPDTAAGAGCGAIGGPDAWRFAIGGRVGKDVEWNWDGFVKLPRVRVFADFHGVTRAELSWWRGDRPGF